MKNILQTYAHQDPELGYVQGMSDLLSPIMMIMEDEADSYWCFIGYMKRMVRPFFFFFFIMFFIFFSLK